MRLLFGTLALACAGLTLPAQQPIQNTPLQKGLVQDSLPPNLFAQNTLATVTQQLTGGCPVEFTATHIGTGVLRKASPAERHNGQGFRLTFGSAERGIATAHIIFHGLAGAQLIPAGTSGKGDSTEDFQLSPATDDHHRLAATVYTEKLTGVRWVEVSDLTYADGTRWHESDTNPCHMAVNGFRLVPVGN